MNDDSDELLDLLRKKLRIGSSASEVKSLIGARFIDKATAYLGGSGAHDIYYQIDKKRQIRFSFDGKSILYLVPIVQDKTDWVRNKQGELIQQPKSVNSKELWTASMP